MTSIATRAVCAMLSTIGAAGLVVFADPAIPVGGHHLAAPAVVVAAASAGPATRG